MATATPPPAIYGLQGRVVAMTSAQDVFPGATVYVDNRGIGAVVKKGGVVPEAYRTAPVYNTGGTIFPGLIELHNHLSYNCLPLWNVPRRYGNRGQWSGIPEYRQNISGPMAVLGKTSGYVEAIVRYVECKCLVAGVTSSQGIMLFSNAGIRKYYRGIVRNVEDSQDLLLPNVDAHIPDIAAKEARHFLSQLNRSSCMLLHLSEGVDETARRHFESLEISAGSWAITPALAGIHCAGLNAGDYGVMKTHGASMVWSPLSNLILYGATADVQAAQEQGIKIGIGSDWSPSGSKNLLGELKVAKLYSDNNGNLFSDYELLAMATKTAAEIIQWEHRLGTIETGKLADLLVIGGQTGDPYDSFFRSSEESIDLVVIDGTPRCGSPALMKRFGPGTEDRVVGTTKRRLNLQQAGENVLVGALTLRQAEEKLAHGLKNLNTIARTNPRLKTIFFDDGRTRYEVPDQPPGPDDTAPEWVLVLDHDEGEGERVRTNLNGKAGGPGPDDPRPLALAADEPLPEIGLDPFSVPDDRDYFEKLAAQMNLPDYLAAGLKAMYKK